MAKMRVGVAACIVVAAAACASTGQQPGASGGNENVITAEELQNAPQDNLLSYIQSHRPRWLQRPTSLTFGINRSYTVEIFLDNSPLGGPDVLQSIPLRSAAEVRWYSPSEAQARFGVGYINGVIQVISRSH